MLLQYSVPHEFSEAKRERYLNKVSATSIRTAEVTNWKTVRSPLTVTVHLKTQSFEDNVKRVMAKASNVMLMVVHHDIRTESMHESMSSPFANQFWPLDSNENCGNFSVTTTVGFEVQEHPLVQNCKLVVTPAMGNTSHDKEKCLSVVRPQGFEAYWAYAPCTMLHTSKPHICCSFRPVRRRQAPCLCQWSPRST